MPYSRAWIWLSVLLLLTVPAFWRYYLGTLGTAEWQLHVHGTTAGLWMALLVWQSWSIHHKRRAAHRAAGIAGLVLMPLFLAGGLLVIAIMATRSTPFAAMFGAPLALTDFISVVSIAAFFYLALKHRRNAGLHGGWMLATAFPLVSPVIARLTPSFVPGLTISSLEELPRFAGSMHLATAIAFLAALYAYSRYRRHGQPFLVVAVMLVAHTIAFQWLGRMPWWIDIHQATGATPPAYLIAVGIIGGSVVVYLGWNAGKPTSPDSSAGSPAGPRRHDDRQPSTLP